MKLHGTMKIENQDLFIGGMSCNELRKKYKTPLYILDEQLVRENARAYKQAFCSEFPHNRVAYAGKAFLPLAMCKLINEEELYLDVVSAGELFTAKKANFPMGRILFHGNAKTLEEVIMGVEYGVGRFVVDGFHELDMIEEICREKNTTQEVYLRITPGIEAHTHDYIMTGQIDSKFGFALGNNELFEALAHLEQYQHIRFVGIHAHIGSQIFELQPYRDEVEILLKLLKKLNTEYGLSIQEVDLGGGFGVYYTQEDHPLSISEVCSAIITHAKKVCQELNIEMPILVIEPGRSIVANAGSTLYTVNAIKKIEGVRTYVTVDGGMSDNIRPSLYNAKYECTIANRMNEEARQSVCVAGRSCESGDILIDEIQIPTVKKGDLLLVATTGAYGYSMSMNYNKIAKPAIISVKQGESKCLVRRQTLEEMLMLEED